MRYGVVQPGHYAADGVPMLRSQDYSRGWRDPSTLYRVATAVAEDYRNARLVAGDLVFTIVGANIGQVASIPEWFDGGVLSRSTARVAVNPAVATAAYVRHSLLTPWTARQTRDSLKTGAQPVVSCADLALFELPLPPLREQEAIAEALSEADALIESLEQLIAKKRLIKQGAMQELLTGKRRLPGFEGEWRSTALGQLGATFGGLTGKTKADFGRGAARYIPFMNVVTNSIVDPGFLENVTVKPGENQNAVSRGDLFFNGSSETPEEVGLCAVLQEDMSDVYVNSFCFGFRPRAEADLDGLYLAYFFRGPAGRELMKSLAQGSTRYNLSKRALLEAEFQLPNGDEQRAIATVLSDIDAELDALDAKLEKARQIKQGMMHNLLTGKIRLV